LRFKFFPGSELSPPTLLGGVVDLDRPQHLVANLFVDAENDAIELRPVNPLPEDQFSQLEDFCKTIDFHKYERVPITAIMHYTTRHRAMC